MCSSCPLIFLFNPSTGQFLYYSAPAADQYVKLELISPLFEPLTKPTCDLEMFLHMYNMDRAKFNIIIKATNTTWETKVFDGNSAHRYGINKLCSL